MSYKERKQHRNNSAKLAILNSESYRIPTTTHFSLTQFMLAAMDNFNHSDASQPAADSTSMALF